MQNSNTLVIRQPDDWHIHLRDADTLKHSCQHLSPMARAIIMPNLKPPVVTVEQAVAYRQRILSSLPEGSDFQPLMTLYLTEDTSLDEIAKAARHPDIHACKLYPAGATTNSDAGVRDVRAIYHLLESMEKHQLPLLVHGEVTHDEVDIFDREKRFIDDTYRDICQQFPGLKTVFEHITTADAVDFVLAGNDNLAATITVHHLLYNRNHLLAGGIRPHYYCLPVLKRTRHQQALAAAAISGNKKFFLGTDSAPHAIDQKESACGCAGIFSSPAAIELYAHFFEQHQALDKLEAFASEHGPEFYGLEPNPRFIRLQKQAWQMPASYPLGQSRIIPICAGERIEWKVDANLLDHRP